MCGVLSLRQKEWQKRDGQTAVPIPHAPVPLEGRRERKWEQILAQE